MHRLAQTGMVRLIVLRVAVDLVGGGSRLSLGFLNEVQCLSVDKYKTAISIDHSHHQYQGEGALLSDDFGRTSSEYRDRVRTCSPCGVLARRGRLIAFLVAFFSYLQPFY